MTQKKAASLSSTLLARKGSAAPAGLSESAPTASTPLPGLLNAEAEQKNGNGHCRPINLERPRKPTQTAKLGCDDPLQPPLIPDLTAQSGPQLKADMSREAETGPKIADPAKPAVEQEQPVQSQATPPTAIKAAPPLRPQSPAPVTAEGPKDQSYPEAPKPRAMPVQAPQKLVAERRPRPEPSASTARLAAAAAGKTGEPIPGPAIAAIATVVILALSGAGYLFLSDNRTTTEVATPLAADTEPTTAVAVAASETQSAEPATATVPSQKANQVTIAVAAGDMDPVAVPAPRPAAKKIAIEPTPVSVRADPQTNEAAEPGVTATRGTSDVVADPASAIPEDIAPTVSAATGAPADTAADIDDGPAPAPHRPIADTDNIIPTVAGAVPLPARKPTRIASLESPAAGSGGRFAVQLASVPSAAAAEREIRRLRRVYPVLFGPMAIDVQRGRGSYRLMSQRFDSRGEAANLCQALKDAGRGCLILAR